MRWTSTNRHIQLFKKSLANFHLASSLIDEVQIGSVDSCDDASAYNSRLSTAHKARVALGGNTTITVDDDFSQAEMMRGLAQQAVQQALKTEVQELDEELGNDYKAKQQVYRPMIARINREEREDEEGS